MIGCNAKTQQMVLTYMISAKNPELNYIIKAGGSSIHTIQQIQQRGTVFMSSTTDSWGHKN